MFYVLHVRSLQLNAPLRAELGSAVVQMERHGMTSGRLPWKDKYMDTGMLEHTTSLQFSSIGRAPSSVPISLRISYHWGTLIGQGFLEVASRLRGRCVTSGVCQDRKGNRSVYTSV